MAVTLDPCSLRMVCSFCGENRPKGTLSLGGELKRLVCLHCVEACEEGEEELTKCATVAARFMSDLCCINKEASVITAEMLRYTFQQLIAPEDLTSHCLTKLILYKLHDHQIVEDGGIMWMFFSQAQIKGSPRYACIEGSRPEFVTSSDYYLTVGDRVALCNGQIQEEAVSLESPGSLFHLATVAQELYNLFAVIRQKENARLMCMVTLPLFISNFPPSANVHELRERVTLMNDYTSVLYSNPKNFSTSLVDVTDLAPLDGLAPAQQ